MRPGGAHCGLGGSEAISPLTPALSPLRGEGERSERWGWIWSPSEPSSRTASNLTPPMRASYPARGAEGLPSPLNGERGAGEG